MLGKKEVIGNCTLYLGDCFNVMPTLDKCDAVLTDPPYGYLKHKLDRQFDHVKWIEHVKGVTRENASFSFFGRGVALAEWTCEANRAGFKFKEEIVWNKRMTTSPFLPLGRVHELFIIFGKGNFKINRIYTDYIEDCFNEEDFKKVSDALKRTVSCLRSIKNISDLHEFLKGLYIKKEKQKHAITTGGELRKGKDSVYKRIEAIERGSLVKSIITVNREHYNFKHPTQKPIQLLDKLIQICTQKNQVILDPFMGSGSTLVSCAKTGRKGIGIEIDPEYFKIACERVHDACKQLSLF